MKILQLMAGAKNGGAENFFVRLVSALSAEGIEQQAVIRAHPLRRTELETNGAVVHEAKYGGMLDPFTRIKLKRIANMFSPDIVMSWMNRAAAAIPAGPWINVGRLGGYYNLKYYKKCDYLICNTDAIRDYVIRSDWPGERAVTLPNFIDETRLPAVNRSLFNTPQDCPLIVCMGRLHPNKAFDVIIDVLGRIENARLWIVGDGPLAGELRQKAIDCSVQDRVRFLGWRQDISAIHAAADVFVCPSRHEPLGNVILEAWAMGTPVVAAAAQGPVQLIVDGENGLLVPVDDPEQLAKAIKRVLTDQTLAARLKEKGKECYFKNFSRAVALPEYIDFFTRICDGRK
jgi:glycosyltransferase involved in cell wall biosynthesis